MLIKKNPEYSFQYSVSTFIHAVSAFDKKYFAQKLDYGKEKKRGATFRVIKGNEDIKIYKAIHILQDHKQSINKPTHVKHSMILVHKNIIHA